MANRHEPAVLRLALQMLHETGTVDVASPRDNSFEIPFVLCGIRNELFVVFQWSRVMQFDRGDAAGFRLGDEAMNPRGARYLIQILIVLATHESASCFRRHKDGAQ